MIKKILLFAMLFFTLQISLGQDVFRKGKNAVAFGGGYKILGTGAPAVNASYERSLSTIRDIGHFGAGLYAAVLLIEDEISPVITARTAFHFGNIRTKHADVYAGLGVAFVPMEDTHFFLDVFMGSRFKLNKKKKFGLFTEVGYYATNIRVGVCWIL